MLQFIRKNEVRISRIAVVIVFLALIRLIGECFRLQGISSGTLSFYELKPFLIGALLAAVACLIMSVLFFYSRSRLVIAVAVLTIASLVAIKVYYKLP